MSDVSKQFLEYRKRSGMTCRAFAQRLGVAFATVQAWEKGKKKPSDSSLEKARQIAENLEE